MSDLDVRAQQIAEPLKQITLNTGQQEALNHLIAHLDEGFGVHLLHGVTGSGKTEVYLRLIEGAMENAKGPRGQGAEGPSEDEPGTSDAPPGAIVLVPEIALTPQTVARFHSRFDHVAVLHSGLTAAQRHAQWRRIREGEANVVIGARSAVFAPLTNLRLIIVDEEHESSYKQDQVPRYHARNVAIKRAQLLGAAVILGSATPSLESYFNAGGAGEVSSSKLQVSSSEQSTDSENLKLDAQGEAQRKTWEMKPAAPFTICPCPTGRGR